MRAAAVRGEKHTQLVRHPLDRQLDVRTEHDVHAGLMM
jgi:NAD-dependent oxidoreductase involved in siderophore biosynthesis